MILLVAITFLTGYCANPFAPALSDKSVISSLSDQTNTNGVFENFRYAYNAKDTIVYGNLLADDFTFVYWNYDTSPMAPLAWGRQEDMLHTNGLFQGTDKLDLIWNEAISSEGDSLSVNISRGFTLTVYFSPSTIVRVQGRAAFNLTRKTGTAPWKISRWSDESFY
ncbi:MAG: hypothetical protein HW421_747 [Ignavibacteria bacterium]|nr:hypothetical protein [Ignavibacteria bacterium]